MRMQRNQSASQLAAQKKAQAENRWGYRLIIRPIHSEPQNLYIGDQNRAHREAVYKQLGGELSCHRLELSLNQLACMASQFTRELANLERFSWATRDSAE